MLKERLIERLKTDAQVCERLERSGYTGKIIEGWEINDQGHRVGVGNASNSKKSQFEVTQWPKVKKTIYYYHKSRGAIQKSSSEKTTKNKTDSTKKFVYTPYDRGAVMGNPHVFWNQVGTQSLFKISKLPHSPVGNI